MIKKKKKYNDIDMSKPIGGPGRVAQIMEEYDENSTNLPKPIYIEDIEGVVLDEFTSGGLSLNIDGRQVPAIYLTNERWGDFVKVWEHIDEDKNVVPPYILIKREGIKKGSMYDIYNTPVKVYDYYHVPTFENGLYGYDIYKIPQPTGVDIEYKIAFVSRYVEDTNTYMEMILNSFKRMQYPIRVNGHFFMITRDEEFGNEGTMSEHDKDRYNVITTNLLVRAYTLNEKDFQITKAYNRTNSKIIIK